MTEISFLHGVHDRLQAVAAWLGQAGSEGRKILVYAPQGDQRDQLDRLLWTLPATGFVPHCMDGNKLSAETPIVLAAKLDNPLHDGCLLNLSDEVPPGFSRFQRGARANLRGGQREPFPGQTSVADSSPEECGVCNPPGQNREGGPGLTL